MIIWEFDKWLNLDFIDKIYIHGPESVKGNETQLFRIFTLKLTIRPRLKDQA